MQIVIEKDIPVPASRGIRGRPKSEITLIAEAMEPGDSFFVPMKQVEINNKLAYLRAKKKFKFATRTLEGGVRVWRLA